MCVQLKLNVVLYVLFGAILASLSQDVSVHDAAW